MACNVRISGSLSALDAVPTITTVFQRGWAVDYDWVADRAVALRQPNQLDALKFPPGFDSDLEGALRGQGKFSDFTYFFKNGQYQRVQHATMTPDGASRATADAWDLPDSYTNLDAVFPGSGKKSQFAYFFRGNDYMRYDWTTDKRSSGYPKTISPNWHTSAPFDRDIDGAIIGVAGFAAKAYLFKTIDVTVESNGNPVPTGTPGSSLVPVPAYARYDFDAEKVDFTETDPAQVVRAWNGLFPTARRRPSARHCPRVGTRCYRRAVAQHSERLRPSLHDQLADHVNGHDRPQPIHPTADPSQRSP